MTDQAMSPLRRRMIEDMSIRKFAPKTQHDYVQRVKDFAAFLGRSPDTAKSEDVRGFRLHLASSVAGTPKINSTVSALRFFFNVTLDRPDLAKHLSFIYEPRKVPVVLSPEEVARFLEAAPCRNRHCPKYQGAAAKQWLAEREADLLPVPYYHLVFTLSAPISDIAYQNKAEIYDILFKASAETLSTITADPKNLGARIGITSVLHTWGTALTHHPHVHMIVPGGGISLGRVSDAGPSASCNVATGRHPKPFTTAVIQA
jgi:hypothetical protein